MILIPQKFSQINLGTYSLLLPLILAVFISWKQTLSMYFWHDDFTGLYYLQQNYLYWWPYHSISLLHKFLLNLLGLEPGGYFYISLFLYFIATFLVYYLLNLFFQNRLLAFFSSLVFASGYVGQEAIMMPIGNGLGTLVGLNFFLLTLFFLFKYFNDGRRKLLLFSLISFFTTLEFAFYRFATAIFVIVGTDLAFSLLGKKKDYRGFFTRSIIFGVLFLIQLLFRPSHYLLGLLGFKMLPPLSYSIQSPDLFSQPNKILEIIHWKYILNIIGSFWNLFYPITYQTDFYFYLVRSSPPQISNYWLLLSVIPLIAISLFILVAVRILRPRLFSWRKIIFYSSVFSFVLFLLGRFVKSVTPYPQDQISILNGLLLLILFFFVLKMGITYFQRYAIFSLILAFGLLSLFFLVKPDFAIESSHRYLLPSALSPAFAATFFITKELVKRGKNIKIAWTIFLLPTILLFFSHISVGYQTQKDFVNLHSQHARRFYEQLKAHIPTIKDKTIIYVEGETRELSMSIADAMRVGALPSEASIAVHYATNIKNIILPETTAEIPRILKENKDLTLDDVFTFIYDGKELRNITQGMRQLLKGKTSVISSFPYSWQVEPKGSQIEFRRGVAAKTKYFEFKGYTLGVYPQFSLVPQKLVSTQLPLKVKVRLKALLDDSLSIPYYHLFHRPEYPKRELWQEILSWEIGQCQKGMLTGQFECVFNRNKVESGKLEFFWFYNTEGAVSQNKSAEIEIPLDETWHDFEFVIPGGGEYLKEIKIEYISFPGTIFVGDLSLMYIK